MKKQVSAVALLLCVLLVVSCAGPSVPVSGGEETVTSQSVESSAGERGSEAAETPVDPSPVIDPVTPPAPREALRQSIFGDHETGLPLYDKEETLCRFIFSFGTFYVDIERDEYGKANDYRALFADEYGLSDGTEGTPVYRLCGVSTVEELRTMMADTLSDALIDDNLGRGFITEYEGSVFCAVSDTPSAVYDLGRVFDGGEDVFVVTVVDADGSVGYRAFRIGETLNQYEFDPETAEKWQRFVTEEYRLTGSVLSAARETDFLAGHRTAIDFSPLVKETSSLTVSDAAEAVKNATEGDVGAEELFARSLSVYVPAAGSALYTAKTGFVKRPWCWTGTGIAYRVEGFTETEALVAAMMPYMTEEIAEQRLRGLLWDTAGDGYLYVTDSADGLCYDMSLIRRIADGAPSWFAVPFAAPGEDGMGFAGVTLFAATLTDGLYRIEKAVSVRAEATCPYAPLALLYNEFAAQCCVDGTVRDPLFTSPVPAERDTVMWNVLRPDRTVIVEKADGMPTQSVTFTSGLQTVTVEPPVMTGLDVAATSCASETVFGDDGLATLYLACSVPLYETGRDGKYHAVRGSFVPLSVARDGTVFIGKTGEPGSISSSDALGTHVVTDADGQHLSLIDGTVVSEPFDRIGRFFDGIALTEKDGKIGMIGADGKTLLAPCLAYDKVTRPDGVMLHFVSYLEEDAFLVPIGGEWAVVSLSRRDTVSESERLASARGALRLSVFGEEEPYVDPETGLTEEKLIGMFEKAFPDFLYEAGTSHFGSERDENGEIVNYFDELAEKDSRLSSLAEEGTVNRFVFRYDGVSSVSALRKELLMRMSAPLADKNTAPVYLFERDGYLYGAPYAMYDGSVLYDLGRVFFMTKTSGRFVFCVASEKADGTEETSFFAASVENGTMTLDAFEWNDLDAGLKAKWSAFLNGERRLTDDMIEPAFIFDKIG